MQVTIRPAAPADLDRVIAVEHAADAKFASVGLRAILDAPQAQVDDYIPAQIAGRLLVALDETGLIVGFVRLDIHAGETHLEQVSVDPRMAGHRVGAQLMHAAEEWAFSRGFHRMTLCTYRDVAWNGPYYERLGWQVMPDGELTAELRALREHERALGLEVQPRQVMVKSLEPGPKR